MKALHSAKYGRFAKHGERKVGQHGRRLVSLLLCLCMVVSMMCNFGGMVLSSAGAQSTQYVLNRLADGDTMDSYIGKLLSSEWGSRYAGRVWTDKTVFAYGDNSTDWLKNVLSLHMSTDGLDSEVTFNSDFAHIFSALASSQTTNAAVPIDLMLALDITASMLNSASNMPSGNIDDQARTTWQGTLEGSGAKNSNMALSLAAANELIAQIRAISSDSRISIVVFHGSGYQMIPFVDGDVKFTGYSLRYDVAGGNSLRGEHPQAIIHYTITDSETDGVSNGDYVYDSISGAHYRYDVGKAPENDTWDGSNNSSRQVEPKDTKTFNVDHFKLGLNTDPDRHGVDVIAEKTKSGMKSTDNDSPTQLGGGTGLEGGIYTAMSSVANMRGDTTYTMPDGMKVTRIPVIVIQGDGATNHVLIKEEDPDASRTPGDAYHRSDPWYSNGPYNSNIDRTPSSNSSIEEQLKNQGSSGNWWNIKSPTATACTYADSSFEADFNAVLQAAYWKAAVANAYDKDLADVFVYTVGLGAKTSVLNPNVGFAGNFGEAGDLDGYTDRTGLYQAFNAWRDEDGMDQYPDNDGKGKITYTFNYSPYTCDHFRGEETLNFYIDAETNTFHIEALASQWGYDKVGNDPYGLERPEMTYNYNRLPDNDVNGVKMEDLELNYTKKYFFVESNTSTDANKVREQLRNAFAGIADEVYQSAVFIPLSGDNDAGVADSITYQDPLGEYMELKNGAITVEKGTVTGSSENTFDMSMLLFGEMHGLVRAGVYDYQWNNDYMRKNETKEGYTGKPLNPDKDPLPIGWYKGDAQTAVYSYNDYGLPGGCTSAADAWAQGWVLRLNYKTLAEFVPISGITDTLLPTEVPEQIKHTVYTCYRFADSQKDRNMLRRNPIFGDVPDSLQKDWEDYFTAHGSYPVGMDFYSGYSGVYRLSDIRVWTEHTGDFVDQTGAITPEEESGYDDSLYINIPVSAVPTQLAEITLGKEGPISYKDNLDQKTQSTPVRLFYAVGLTEDLILRDADGNQTGVDVSKISGEYIANHSDPETNNIYFISNWYSNTPYRGYTSDAAEEYRTRGDAAVSFSPNAKNRYYLFQKPLPLIAHAYRVLDADGNVAPVDNADGKVWGDNGSGNGTTKWETVNGVAQSAASWVGGEFIGTYENQAAFQAALKAAKSEPDSEGNFHITDAKNYTYLLPDDITDAVITYTKDQLSKVDSDTDGYTEDSNSFSSDDYFFLCIEYYLPMEGYGTDIHGKEDTDTQAVRKVSRMIARKGSAFGSGLHSEYIDNGDMLCWTDIKGNCTLELEYNSRTDTGDNTRGRPTLEKLTKTGEELRTYLSGIGLVGEHLEADVTYWTNVQADPHMAELIAEINASSNPQQMFNKLFDWSVAARTGGIRVGDMFNNMQAKLSSDEIKEGTGPEFDDNGQYYLGNVTHTANNYYIPTLSEASTSGDGLIINNFLGNNGRLEVANATLMVTKTLVAPDGFILTEDQQNETFDYQVYVQGLTGERLAQRLKWNPFSQSWQKRVETMDILTDNASLLVDTSGSRALFCYESDAPRQIVEVYEDEAAKYYYADATGAATTTPCNHQQTDFYYLYLPNSAGELNYPLFASTYEDGTTNLDGVGTTAYYPAGMDTTKLPAGDNGNQTFAKEITEQKNEMDNRPAGSREYWTKQAVLIPYNEVTEAETWEYASEKLDSTYKALTNEFTLVTVIPDPEGTDSTVYSPYRSRTTYMTTSLYFGYTADLAKHLETEGETFATCDELVNYELKGTDLYDQIIPTVDRPNLFNNTAIGDTPAKNNDTPDKVAKNTAEFTLKNGEGLLLTGLGNRITYRFTEKLTEDQLKQGYTLKEISHVQQRGSDTVYMPGVQNIEVDGKLEPFAHTNATIWESYATMAPNALGNHHQPTASEGGKPAQNPSCVDAKTEENLGFIGCDIVQTDGSTRHYFYYGGKLVDPHYDGEQDGMSRYVLNPTAHFGVNGEEGMKDALTSVPSTILGSQASGDTDYYDYNGVYSVYGDTGYFSEKANYTNTIDPEMLVVTKEVVDKSGNHVAPTPDMVFDYTLELSDTGEGSVENDTIPALTGYDTLYLWRGSKDTMTSALKWTDKDAPEKEYTMPATAPNLDEYRTFIPTEDSPTEGKTYLQPVTLTTAADGKLTYKFKLKADEAVVFYGIPAGTDYTVTETNNPNYPISETHKADDPYSQAGSYVQTGEVLHYRETSLDASKTVNHVAMRAKDTDNRENYYNLISTGFLTVEKEIHDDDKWEVDKTFTFTVTLTAGGEKTLNAETLAVTKYKKTEAGGETSEDITKSVSWNSTVVDGKTVLTAEIKLMHGERFVISGIPMDTKYTVKETDRDGYNLEYVVDRITTPDITNSNNFIHPEDFSTNGEITEEHPQASWLFVNAKPPFLPFSGSGGVGLFYLLGAALIISGIIFMCFSKKRRVRIK